MIRVSAHALDRYRERVRMVSYEEARAALSTPLIEAAAAFGARYVRLGTGHRILINAGVVVTVMPVEQYRRQIRRHGLGRYGRGSESSRYYEGE
ncbi:hypothetical protein [Novosphingobium resinovorum]|uniref:Uncharacterized protein n=1 Tax=Novosphingobium resinovorum TaxID=158500 RepID=A0A1D8A522_9SPHN|nr:hypothetical protein [Novosphingobium resinovorum]AOR77208.1 hypothetical protein BES08_10940 [Novosphingobium resinovorum]